MSDENVIGEAIVGAFGLPHDREHVSIKGDPSLRETVALRPRQDSRLDSHASEVLAACEWLLEKSGCYGVYIGFNSSEVRTESVFNAFNYEIHDALALTRKDYLEQHFVPVPYLKKMSIIRQVRRSVQTGDLRKYLPGHWRRLTDQNRRAWRALDKKAIGHIVSSLGRLREIEGFYLRNATISLSQNMVHASFNCDGTYIVAAECFSDFVDKITG